MIGSGSATPGGRWTWEFTQIHSPPEFPRTESFSSGSERQQRTLTERCICWAVSMSSSNCRKVLECGGCDTAFESATTFNTNESTNSLIRGLNHFRRLQCHRSNQSRFQQRRVLRIMMPRREGETSRGAGLSFEQPLWPFL